MSSPDPRFIEVVEEIDAHQVEMVEYRGEMIDIVDPEASSSDSGDSEDVKTKAHRIRLQTVKVIEL